jgi:hypothetical protein
MPDYFNTFIVAFLGGAASGVTGLVGLAFTQRYSDNRKLIDLTLQEMEKLIDQCAKSAGSTWSVSGDPTSESSIETVCLLHDISSYATFIVDRVMTAEMLIDDAHIKFRRATTGDKFDVKGRAPDIARVSEIRSSAAAFKMAVRSVNYDRNTLSLW